MDKVIEEIGGIFRQNGVPLFGFGPASPLEDAPPRYRPADYLSSAKSIVCLGIPVPRAVFRCGGRANDVYGRAVNIYYRKMDSLLLQAACALEDAGHPALPVFGCFPYEVKGRGDLWGFVSLPAMAEAVGLGKIGRNGLLFNSVYGPRLILGGVVTSATLPAMAWPGKDEKGCPEGCSVCRESCPVKAIDETGRVDRAACVFHSMNSPILNHLVKSKEFGAADMQGIINVAGVDDHSMYNCTLCVSACPYC